MDERWSEAIDRLIGWIEASAGFVEEQAPLVAMELIQYQQVLSGIVVVLGVIASGVCVGIFVLTCHRAIKDQCRCGFRRTHACNHDSVFASIVVSGGFLIPLGIALSIHLPLLLQTILAPRVFILNYLRGLL